MKHKKYILFILVAVVAFTTSCSKEFLETNPPTQVSDQELFKTVNGAQTVLNGTYRYMRSKSGVAESSGIISWQNGFDAAAKDLIVFEAQGYMQAYYNHFILASTRADGLISSNTWGYFYTLIGNANNILANIDGIPGDATKKEQIKAQALAIRGWSYFYLARLFMQTYSIAKDQPCVPYYDKPGTIGKPREKVSVIYQHVVDDLKAAITGLAGFNRGAYKNQINQSVAQGILAEVYLTMEDWANAAATAKLARTGTTLMTATQFKAGFNDWNVSEWMWGQHQTIDATFGDITSFTLWANKSRGTRWTYDTYCVNDVFKNMFSATDVRNQFWLRTDYNLWTSDKFRDNSTGTGDVIMMRAAEMYLIEAEALARQNQDQPAKDVLWVLQDARNAARSASTGAALIDDILVERRKELYGEGFAWFDMLRTGTGLNRTGDHPRKITLPARSWRLILQLPTGEFTTNTALKSTDQNPYDGVF